MCFCLLGRYCPYSATRVTFSLSLFFFKYFVCSLLQPDQKLVQIKTRVQDAPNPNPCVRKEWPTRVAHRKLDGSLYLPGPTQSPEESTVVMMGMEGVWAAWKDWNFGVSDTKTFEGRAYVAPKGRFIFQTPYRPRGSPFPYHLRIRGKSQPTDSTICPIYLKNFSSLWI